jgi:prevent-host-death family protein
MAAKPVSVHEAKTQLSRLLVRVIAGETIVIARSGRPVARLVPITAPDAPRVPGQDDVRLSADFDRLPAKLRRAFGMR